MSFNEQYNKAMEKIYEKYKNVDPNDESKCIDLQDPTIEKILDKGIENTKILNKFEELYEYIFETWEDCFERVIEEECDDIIIKE